MAKKDEVVAQPDPVVVIEEMTLEEFLTRLSSTDRRVELLSGFYSRESQAGNLKDTEKAFKDRFVAYVNTPV